MCTKVPDDATNKRNPRAGAVSQLHRQSSQPARPGARDRPCRSHPHTPRHAEPHAAPLQTRARLRLGSRQSGQGRGVANKWVLAPPRAGPATGQSARTATRHHLRSTGARAARSRLAGGAPTARESHSRCSTRRAPQGQPRAAASRLRWTHLAVARLHSACLGRCQASLDTPGPLAALIAPGPGGKFYLPRAGLQAVALRPALVERDVHGGARRGWICTAGGCALCW